MWSHQKLICLGAILSVSAILSGCSSSSARYADTSACQTPPPCNSVAAVSRYGSEARCEIVIKECWGVRWVAVPTYHQIIVPIMRPAPEPEYTPEPPVYVPPAPEPTPPVIEEPPVYVPPAPEPPVYEPPKSYPEPPVYIPPPPVIRK